LRTREYPPATLLGFRDSVVTAEPPVAASRVGGQRAKGLFWAAVGMACLTTVAMAQLDRQLYLVGAGALLWGLALLAHQATARMGLFGTIMHDLEHMPHTMRRLVPVQFFSWLALFAMWIYTTPAVTQVHFHSTDPGSAAYNDGANWVGVLFGAYNGFAALAAVIIPLMVRRWGLRRAHLVNVWLGGAGFLSMAVIRDPHWLLLSMLGVGFAWASILSIPYALLSDSVPAEKMGLYMGIFNFFIVIPQLVAASVLGFLLKTLFGGAPIRALTLGGVCFLIAGLLALRVPEPGDPPRTISG
ncbi:MAG TPA: MFS transporter, partial [Steroidobacteraceae bacterium]